MDVLFCYVKEHPDLGYRQGMHELLAPILFVLHAECRDDLDTDDTLRCAYMLIYTLPARMSVIICFVLLQQASCNTKAKSVESPFIQ